MRSNSIFAPTFWWSLFVPTFSVPIGFSYSIAPDHNPIQLIFTSPAGNGLPELVLANVTGSCSSLPTVGAIISPVLVTPEPEVARPPDTRINWQFGDSNVGILYEGLDGSLDLYEYNTDTYHFGFITSSEVAPYLNNPPESASLIRSIGRIYVYVLPSGVLQFNFGPDAEGKIWAFLMKDLEDRENEGSYLIDPNQ